MAGLETAGVVLAALPILASTAKHFKKAHGRFKTFGHEADLFLLNLEIQRTVFNTKCQILLAEATSDKSSAEDMIRDLNHPLWQDEETEESLCRYVGKDTEVCLNAIAMISRMLKDIETEGDSLEELLQLERHKKHEVTGDKKWRKRTSGKVAFSISNGLDPKLAALKSLISDLGSLIEGVGKLERYSVHSRPANHVGQLRDIGRYQLVHKASNHLYDALGVACTIHNEHVVHFCLRPVLNHQSRPQVRFNIALEHRTISALNTSSPGVPVWFDVESEIKEPSVQHQKRDCSTLEGLSNSLKRREPVPASPPRKKLQKKVVRFRSPSPPPHAAVQCVPPSLSLPVPAPLLNLCRNQNFCNQIQRRLQQMSQRMNETCIGLLGGTPSCSHLIYLPSPPYEPSQRQPTSLTRLFRMLSGQGLTKEVPIYERARLGKLLATAVLQFHATPWLTRLRSDDLLFFGVEPSGQQASPPSLTSPYMNVAVKKGDDAARASSTLPSRVFAPNSLLFSLAVIFHELAHQEPLSRLRRPIDMESGLVDRHTEFAVAKRLLTSSSPMGPRYTEIVRRCLYCDFGQGHDLRKPELQGAVFRKVICELEVIEQQLRDFHLSGP